MVGITGNVRNRFVQAAVLLHKLDPVRGEPTAYGLDQHPHEIESPRERLLKRKFLDSFALMCATEKDADSVSAACIEEGRPEGTVIRVSSNSGVSETTLNQLREIVDVLSGIASRGKLSPLNVRYLLQLISFSFQVRDPSLGEEEILLRIIRLDIKKIRQYLKDLRFAKGVLEKQISAVELRLSTSSSQIAPSGPHPFLKWLRHVFVIRDLPLVPEPEILVDHIRWAQIAKRHYIEFLKAVFSSEAQPLPRWVRTTFKLGRYGIASRALVQLACELPALVNPMIVEPVIAPPKTHFTLSEEQTPLACVLRRVIGGDKLEEFVPRLARVWNTTDAETHFRTACSLDLVAHAEMQLVNFYDHNPQWRPQFRFVGVSKKSCYLCHLFLTNHPDSFCVSSCHQKLYPSWIPPLATDSKIYKQWKAITLKLCEVMEATAKQELGGRLGTTRRPLPPDSTAGVSLSGLTDSNFTGRVTQPLVERRVEFVSHKDSTMDAEPQSSSRLIEVVSLTPTNVEIDSAASSSEREFPESTDQFSETGSLSSISAMVFHFMRPSDASKQDIIRVSDILDHSTDSPSWAKLVELLRVDDGFGLAFKEGLEFLVFNNQIRVTNERQLLAFVQYQYNSHILNSEALVCTASEAFSPQPH